MYENYKYVKEKFNFSEKESRISGTFQNYDSMDDVIDPLYYYMQYIKFGFGRATSDTAHEIRDGKITREEGIALVKKYDGEFPKKYYKSFLEYCSITEQEFENIVDSWRSDHIWSKDTSGKWILKEPIWK